MDTRSNAVDVLFATLIEQLEEDPRFDVQGFFEQHSAHAPALKTRLERLRRVGLTIDARGESTLVAAMRERFGVHSELPLRRPHAGGAAEPAEELLPSRVIGGRYRVLAEIGRGGMGRVFRALDLDLGRDVALKVADLEQLLPASDTAQRRTWIERFLLEAQVTAQLEHPSIVPVHDIGVDKAGQLYYTMKLVEGETLAAKIEQWHAALAAGQPFPTPELLRIVLQVCQAVAFAHERGVMHRDLKPSNVMVGRFGEVQVMDWGLAKLLGAPVESQPVVRPRARARRSDSHTLAGEILGTPTHMAPEQARGDAPTVGRAADVYGIGAMLHHGLGGAPPNRAPGERRDDAPRPWRLPAELEAICRRALHPTPDLRYSSAATLAADLQAFLDGRVVRAYEAGALATLRKWIQRNRALATALAATLLALAAGLGAALVLKAQADARAEDVLRLSAFQELSERIAEANELWPADPTRVAEFQDWIGRARSLVQTLPAHRARLRRLENRTDVGSRWWKDQLGKLIQGLESLESGLLATDAIPAEHGWSVPKRLAFALSLQHDFAEGGRHEVRWRAALPTIREAYPDLRLEPQIGLVPLGPDPTSGLWEFAHLATGEPSERDAHGRLLLREESGLVFVLVPGGTFWMGAQSRDPAALNHDPDCFPDEGPPHAVRLSPYFLSKYEMTQGQYLRITGVNPSYYDPSRAAPELQDHSAASLLLPVEYISWEDATRVCARLGLSLPSEAQWERATRAGTTTAYWTDQVGEALASAANLADAWCKSHGGPPGVLYAPWDDGYSIHAPVGSFRANAFGFHDVLGNVAEWCRDAMEEGYYLRSPATDPVNDPPQAPLRVRRGGSFHYPMLSARSANRGSTTPTFRESTIGLRPARPLN